MKLNTIMSQTNPILILPNNICNIQFNTKFLYTHVFEEAFSLEFFGHKCLIIYCMATCPVQRVLFDFFTPIICFQQLLIFTTCRKKWKCRCLNDTVALPLGNFLVISLIRSWVDPRFCLGVRRTEMFLSLPEIVAVRPAPSLVTVPTKSFVMEFYPLGFFLSFLLSECCP